MEISLDRKSIPLLLTFTLLMILAMPVFFPRVHLNLFAPFLIVVCYQRTFLYALWAATLAGLFLDLLSAPLHFGIYSITYSLTTLLLYSQRRHFFADSLSTLPIMTFLFSLLAGLIEFGLVSIFEKSVSLTLWWILIDLIGFSLLDGLYAFAFFIFPKRIFGKKQKLGKDYFAN